MCVFTLWFSSCVEELVSEECVFMFVLRGTQFVSSKWNKLVLRIFNTISEEFYMIVPEEELFDRTMWHSSTNTSMNTVPVDITGMILCAHISRFLKSSSISLVIILAAVKSIILVAPGLLSSSNPWSMQRLCVNSSLTSHSQYRHPGTGLVSRALICQRWINTIKHWNCQEFRGQLTLCTAW